MKEPSKTATEIAKALLAHLDRDGCGGIYMVEEEAEIARIVDEVMNPEREATDKMREWCYKVLREGVKDRHTIRNALATYEIARKGK